jgi:hypothetical protein
MRYAIVLLLLLAGCAAFKPGPAGNKAREEVKRTIQSAIPSPWGEVAAGAFGVISTAIALSKGAQARKARKVAKAACTAIEASGDKNLKHAAKKAGRFFRVEKELGDLAVEVETENDALGKSGQEGK